MRIDESVIKDWLDKHPHEEAWLDYKETVSTDERKKADLVHDVLSMANYMGQGDRFLLIGISDDAQIVGLDSNIKETWFADVLSRCQFNRDPTYEFYFVLVEGKKVGVLQISDEPYKPYFLREDFKRGKKTVRAGVVYSRNGANNTPIDRGASESEIERMWQQRFGLLLSPLEQAKIFIRQPEKWLYTSSQSDDELGTRYFYDRPEFTITSQLIEYPNFYEPWLKKMTKTRTFGSSMWGNRYQVRYFGTVLMEGELFHPRHTTMPFPKMIRPLTNDNINEEIPYAIDCNSEEFLVSHIVDLERRQLDQEPLPSASNHYHNIWSDSLIMFGGDAFDILPPNIS